MTDIQKIRQKVFDKALTHLREQGRKSMGRGTCAYRGDDGLKCAIGIFISDKKYGVYLEGQTTDTIIDLLPVSVSKAGQVFLCNLQTDLHDDLMGDDFLKDLEEAAPVFTNRYNLTYSAPVTP